MQSPIPLKLNCCGHFIDMPEHETARPRPTDYLLIWALGGRGFAEVEGQRFDVGAGDLLVMLPRRPQWYGAVRADPWEILWMHVAGRTAAAMVRALRTFGGPCLRLGRDDRLRERFTELVVHSGRTTEEGPGEPVWPDTEALALLGLMWQRLDALSRVPPRPSPLDAVAVARYIHDHLAQTLTLDELADAVHLSPAHFARLFRAHFGVSPMRYVNQKRIDVACALLAETNMKLWQIAQQAGFADPFYFSRLFHRTTGVPPSTYRARQRGTSKRVQDQESGGRS